jgi:hypothetical protein
MSATGHNERLLVWLELPVHGAYTMHIGYTTRHTTHHTALQLPTQPALGDNARTKCKVHRQQAGSPGTLYSRAAGRCTKTPYLYVLSIKQRAARCSLLAAAAPLRAHEVAPVARPQHRSAANGACRVLAACCRFSFSDELSCASTTTLWHNHCCGVTFLQFAQPHLAWCIRTGHVHVLVRRTDEMHAVWCTAAQMSGSGTRSQWYSRSGTVAVAAMHSGGGTHSQWYSGSGSDTQWRWHTVAVARW